MLNFISNLNLFFLFICWIISFNSETKNEEAFLNFFSLFQTCCNLIINLDNFPCFLQFKIYTNETRVIFGLLLDVFKGITRTIETFKIVQIKTFHGNKFDSKKESQQFRLVFNSRNKSKRISEYDWRHKHSENWLVVMQWNKTL